MWPLLVTALATSLSPLSAEEDLNRMLGRQAHNTGIPVVPVPGPVKIDGDLSEWDLSGRIWSFSDVDVRDEYSVQTAAMWDRDALYITTIWRDPTPMVSAIDPDINPTWGWKSDAVQIRISSDKTQWLTFWHYTPREENILHIETWQSKENSRPPRTHRLLRSKPGGTDLGEGVEVAYRKAEDGHGFIQEMRIPWKLIYDQVPGIKPGNTIDLGLEFLWGDPGGTRPFHRYSDNLQPGTTSREFFWTNYKGWGPAQLLASGKVAARTYVAQEWQLRGVLPIRFELPAAARRFTVVIDDEEGNRVRSLGADLSPGDYKTGEKEGKIIVSVPWDLRDNLANIVPGGSYKARGLYHEGLQASFDAFYYQPGTPPWNTADSSSAWLGDHTAPYRVASAGGLTFVGCKAAEGGHGLIAIDREGKKIWGEHRGAVSLAADERYVYAVAYSEKATGTLWRYDHQGEYRAYTLNGETASFDLELTPFLDPALSVSALAVEGGNLVFALKPREEGEPQLAVLDKETLKPLGKAALPEPITHLATDGKGTLYGLSETALYRLDPRGGKHERLRLPGVARPTALAIDGEGRFLLYDSGPDRQIKRFTAEGKPAGSIGKKGGHPRHGVFDPSGIREVSSLSVDADGLIWATSHSMNPRRVSAWSGDGKRVRDFIGNAQYAGTGSYLDPTKQDYAYIGSLEFRIDRENNRYELRRILWNPDTAKNEAFELWNYPHWFANPVFVESAAGGGKHRYLFNNSRTCAAIYMERGDHYQPVAAIFNKEYAETKLPGIQWPDPKKMTVFWNDTNRDGAVSPEECEIVPDELRITGYWGSIPGDGLELYAGKQDGTIRHRPVGFDPDGAPRYGTGGMETLELASGGDYSPVPQEKEVLVLGSVGKHAKGILGVDPDFSRILWHWPSPYNNVHGSHRAPMSRPGLVIGGLKFMGTVEVNGEVGRVTAIRGNLGQDYYFTTDGLLIGALFRDTRLPQNTPPDTLEELRRMPLGSLTMGGEPFSGWLGRMPDGRILNTTSLIRQAGSTIEITGLDKVKRFKVDAPVRVDDALRVKAEAIPPMLDPSEERHVTYSVKRVKTPPLLEGKEADKAWGALHRAPIESATSAFKGNFRIGYDDANLYVQLETDDPSPWKNGGRNFATLFKTGDAFDLQIGPAEPARRRNPGEGDQRIVIAPFNGKPTAVLMRPVDPEGAARHTYRSPVMERAFDRVEILEDLPIRLEAGETRWRVRAIIPFSQLGLKVEAGGRLLADIGFISSDQAGTLNIARTYWSNRQTNLVNDEPSEAWFAPERWGTLVFEPAK